MKVTKFKGINQSGANCKGFSLVCNFGYTYLACKAEHKPDDPWLGLPLADFWSSTVFGEQFLQGLNPWKNDNDIISQLFFYLSGDQFLYGNYNQHQVIEFIAQELQQKRLFIYPLQDKKQLFANLHFPPPPVVIPPEVVKVVEEEKKECFLRIFSLKCKHGDRNYVHDMTKWDNRNTIFNVVGEDSILVYTDFHCDYENPNCPSVYLNGPNIVNQLIPSGEKFNVTPPMEKLESKVLTVMGAIQQLPFGKKHKYKSYSVVAKGCDYRDEAKIQVYDTYSWKGQFEVSYDNKAASDNWRIENNLSGELAGVAWKTNAKNHIFTNIINGLNNIIQGVSAISEESTHANLTPAAGTSSKSFCDFLVPPKIKIGGDLTLNEKIGSPELVYDGNLLLDFDPLIGLKFKFDLVEYLIKYYLPGVGVGLLKARDKAAAGIGKNGTEAKLELVLDLVASMTLSAHLKWEFNDGICTIPEKSGDDTKAGLLLGVSLDTHISGELKSFIATIVFIAKMEIAGVNHPAVGLVFEAYEAVVDNEPALHLRGLWTGIKVTTTVAAEVGIGADDFDNSAAKEGKKGSMAPDINTESLTSDSDSLMTNSSYDSFSFGSLPKRADTVNPEVLSYTGYQKEYPHGPSIFDPHIIFDTGKDEAPKFMKVKFMI